MRTVSATEMSRFGILALAVFAAACAPSAPKGAQRAGGGATSDVAIAAQKTYVAPGDLDEYYFFASGGHSGQMYVYGVPSMRHLSTIPVFTPYPATGYGYIHRGPEVAKRNSIPAAKVQAFREKPDADLAERFVASGEYDWNAGIFVWKAATILKALRENVPPLAAAVERGLVCLFGMRRGCRIQPQPLSGPR